MTVIPIATVSKQHFLKRIFSSKRTKENIRKCLIIDITSNVQFCFVQNLFFTFDTKIVFDTFVCVNLSQIIWHDQLVLVFSFRILPKNTHNPHAMTEYIGRDFFLNLKLDPSPVCLKELQRNKLTTHCTWIVQKDSLHFSFVSSIEKRKVANNCPFTTIYCVLDVHCTKTITHSTPNQSVLLLK